MDAENTIEETVSNKVLTIIGTKRTLVHRIRNRELKFHGHIMSKVGLENKTLIRHTESKRRETWSNLPKWICRSGNGRDSKGANIV